MAFLLDTLRQRQPRIPMTYGLIAINVLVFVVMKIAGAPAGYASSEIPLAWGANFGPATQDEQWWRLGSAMFLHFGLLHLVFNMVALWDGGLYVERLLGSTRFVVLYLLCGLAGNVLSLAVQGNQAVSCGASGAIFGIYGALLVAVWRRRRELERREFLWLFGGGCAFTLVSLGVGFVVRGIDNSAHGGGLVTGLLLGFALLPQRPTLRRFLIAAIWLCAVALTIDKIPPPRYLWHEEAKARQDIQTFLELDLQANKEINLLAQYGRSDASTAPELADLVESRISSRYGRSFAALSRLSDRADLPSSQVARELRDYAGQRLEASQTFAEGLRTNNADEIQRGLALERDAGQAHSGKSAVVPPRGPRK